MQTVDGVTQTLNEILPGIVALRHELHTHPEIRFEESWTSDRIARFLEENGIPHSRGHAKGTGIVAHIEGDGNKTVALRADMDALEIKEQTGLPYASTIPNRMHACGHDGHTACLCGVAKILHSHSDLFQGTVKLIFQPAEEQGAGASYMVEEGVMDDVDAIFGLHCWPTLPTGMVAVKSGVAMASADFFRIEIIGKGCHAADPGAGVDPVVVASQITTALQHVVSREINPWDPAVLTVAKIEAGDAANVIPESAILVGTFRALREKVRLKIHDAIERIATHTALAHRATAQVRFEGIPYPPLRNDPVMSQFAKETVIDIFGPDRLSEPKHPTMASEDFAFYLQKAPGAFVYLGNNPSQTEAYPALHSPHFDFNDEALPTGMTLLSGLAIRFLAQT